MGRFPKDLNRHRSKLIPLRIGKNYMNMNPAKLNQELEEWLHRIGLILGTWCDEAPHWWHREWLQPPQNDKYGLEKVYKFGGALPIPVKSNCVETVLRVELADPSTNILPGFIIERALKLGYNTTESLLLLTLRELLPSEDLNKIVITDELETSPTNAPTTYGGLTGWFETWLNKLMVAKSMDSFPKARKCLSVVTAVLQPCLQGDALLFHSWNNKYLELNLRDKVTLEDLEQLTRYMYLEARNRTRETKLEERVNKQVNDYVSSNAATPKGKGKDKTNPKGKGKEESPGKGTPKCAGKDSKGNGGKEGKKGTTYCAEYYTDAGCPNGDACKKYHPRVMGRCFRCGSPHHGLAACSRPARPTNPGPEASAADSAPNTGKPNKTGKDKGKGKGKKGKGKGKGKGRPKAANAEVAEDETWEEGGEDWWYDEGGEEWPEQEQQEQPAAAHAEIEEDVICAKASMDARDQWGLHGAWLHRVHTTPRSTTFKPDWGLAKLSAFIPTGE
eukprot:3183708-Amphidinium_carterae.1